VHRELQDKLKKKDIVLLDYRPMKNSPAPRMKIVKILSPKKGERALKNYSEFHSSEENLSLRAFSASSFSSLLNFPSVSFA